MRLTPNFDAHEFDVHEPWPAGFDANRLALAQLDQWLRDLAGVPGVITSAWRSPARNETVGGSETSQHMKAEATDVVFRLVPLRVLAERVLASVRAHTAPAFGQVIFYPVEGHVHVSLPTLGTRNGEIRYRTATGYPFLTDPERQLPLLSRAQVRAGFHWPAHSPSSPCASASGGTSGAGADGASSR